MRGPWLLLGAGSRVVAADSGEVDVDWISGVVSSWLEVDCTTFAFARGHDQRHEGGTWWHASRLVPSTVHSNHSWGRGKAWKYLD